MASEAREKGRREARRVVNAGGSTHELRLRARRTLKMRRAVVPYGGPRTSGEKWRRSYYRGVLDVLEGDAPGI